MKTDSSVLKMPIPVPNDDSGYTQKKIAAGLSSDLRGYNDWMNWYWNTNPVMRSPKFTGYHIFEEMDADAHIYNCMSLAKEPLVSRPYTIRSARPGDELEDFKAAFVAYVLDHIKHLAQRKREILSAYDYGYSVSEMILGQEDVVIPEKTIKKNGISTTIPAKTLKNAWIIKDIETKVPNAFSFNWYGKMLMADVKPPKLGDPMPVWTVAQYRELTNEELQHFLVFTHDPRFGNRRGWPMKASMFWDYLMKKAGKIFRMIRIEKYGMPWLKGTYPTGVPPTGDGSTAQFEEKLKGLQKNSYIMKPVGFEIEFVESSAASGTVDIYQNLMDFCDGNVSEITLGHRQAITSSEAGTGTSSQVKEGSLRQDKLKARAADMDAVFNDQFIMRLIDWNFTSNGMYPYMVTDVEPESDKDKKIFRLTTARNANLPTSKTEWYEALAVAEPQSVEDTLPGVGDAKPIDTVGGDNLPNTNISDGTVQTKGNPEQDAMQ